MNQYIVTVTYKDIDDNKLPFLCKEKFTVKASTFNKALEKAHKAMQKQHFDEYHIEDIKQR